MGTSIPTQVGFLVAGYTNLHILSVEVSEFHSVSLTCLPRVDEAAVLRLVNTSLFTFCVHSCRQLWEPQSSKAEYVKNVVYHYGVCDDVGLRPYMEDRHVVFGDVSGNANQSLYAVFDGHGGARAADFCARNIPLVLSNALAGGLTGFEDASTEPSSALGTAFSYLDQWWLQLAASASPAMDDGTTAVAALVVADAHKGAAPGATKVFVANAGDSRAVVVKRSGRVQPLTEDHKPNRPDEMARIRAAGGTVQFFGVWRVQGVLAVSRAIGDRMLKPYVISSPEVTQYCVTPHDQYLVLATDGLWDVLSSTEVASVLSCLPDNSAGAAAQLLVKEALTRGSTDNITALVVDLTQPQYPAEHVAAAAGSSKAPQGKSAPAGTKEQQQNKVAADAVRQEAGHGAGEQRQGSQGVEGGHATAVPSEGGSRKRSWAKKGVVSSAGALRGASALEQLAARGAGTPSADASPASASTDQAADELRALKAADAGTSKVE